MQPVRFVIPMVVTDKVAQTRDFYEKHFGLQVSFDCGWYVSLKAKPVEHGEFEIAFREPKGGEPCCAGGLAFGLQVADADAELARLRKEGVAIDRDIASNPWGDRSFLVHDPSGVGVYVFHSIEPSAEFRQYLRS
jgi:catechol 2,3-dioxygenase-like lactoylglutathione lyase family enzyme